LAQASVLYELGESNAPEIELTTLDQIKADAECERGFEIKKQKVPKMIFPIPMAMDNKESGSAIFRPHNGTKWPRDALTNSTIKDIHAIILRDLVQTSEPTTEQGNSKKYI